MSQAVSEADGRIRLLKLLKHYSPDSCLELNSYNSLRYCIRRTPYIKRLRLYKYPTSYAAYSLVRSFTQLTELDLTNCSNSYIVGLEIKTFCIFPNLRTLCLTSGCSSSAEAMLKVFKNLQEINMKYTPHIFEGNDVDDSYGIILRIAKYCPQLVTVNFSFCELISDSIVFQLSEGCKNLQSIDLSHCSKITDSSLEYISDKCNNLLVLRLEACKAISDVGLRHIAEGCLKIKTLVVGSENISNLSLSYISTGLKYLERFHIYDNNRITEEGLTAMIANCETLIEISVVNCSNISLGYITELEALYRNIDFLIGNSPEVNFAGIFEADNAVENFGPIVPATANENDEDHYYDLVDDDNDDGNDDDSEPNEYHYENDYDWVGEDDQEEENSNDHEHGDLNIC